MTPNKRLKEARRRDQQREKEERKRARRDKASADNKTREPGAPEEEDPDIAGIIPGPQPIADDIS